VPQRIVHIRRGGDFEFVFFEDDLQPEQHRFIVIDQQKSYGCHGRSPLCRLHTDEKVPSKLLWDRRSKAMGRFLRTYLAEYTARIGKILQMFRDPQ
jgi:hypothetical protein